MSSVPLPWCTSKSTIATRCRPCRSSAYLAAMATLLKMQKPMARESRQAWCPGGRTAQNALSSSPGDHRVGGRHGRTGRPQDGAPGVHIHRGVGVDLRVARATGVDFVSQHRRSSPRMAATCMRSCASSISSSEARGASRRSSAIADAAGQQPVFDRIQPLRALGVARAHFVFPAIAVGEISGLAHSNSAPFSGNVMRSMDAQQQAQTAPQSA